MEEKKLRKTKAAKVVEPAAVPPKSDEIAAGPIAAVKTKEIQVIAVDPEEKELAAEVTKTVPQLFNEAQRNLVMNETPRWRIKRRPGRGGLSFDYVDVGYVVEQLNILAGYRWDFIQITDITPEFIKMSTDLGQFIVQGRLVIYGDEGKVAITKENTGKAEIKKQGAGWLDPGNDLKAAWSDCLKKCASWFGIALDIYSGAVARRQDTMHPEAKITESQRRRLEVLASDAGIGHAGLKKIINEKWDYTSTQDIQRRHYEEIVRTFEGASHDAPAVEIPEDIRTGFEILGTPEPKQRAIFASFSKQPDGIEALRKKINTKVDEKNNPKAEGGPKESGAKTPAI